MSPGWTGTITIEAPVSRHFWCEPTWWTIRAPRSFRRIRMTTSRAVMLPSTCTLDVQEVHSQAHRFPWAETVPSAAYRWLT